jgi:flagellar biosynthetic protein FliO
MEGFQQAATVAAVLALLGATLWWLRRRGFATLAMGRKPGGRRLECLERLNLGPQQTLHLVRVGQTALLLASSPTGCALVRSFSCGEIAGEIEAPIEATPEASQ